MALLEDGIRQKGFDVRMVQRGLNKGVLLKEEVNRHLKDLPDDSENAEFVNLEVLGEGIAGNSGLRE